MALAAGYANNINVNPNSIPYGQPNQMYNAQPQQYPSDEMIWVSGINEANAYPVAPGTSKRLYDRNDPIFYIKTVDLSGMPMKLRIFHYWEETSDNQEGSTDEPKKDYVTKDDLEKFKSDIMDLFKKNQYYKKPQQNKEDKVNA